MLQKYCFKNKNGFSVVEALLASSIFALLAILVSSAVAYGQQSNLHAGMRNRAIFFAEEGLEAVRNIRDGNFAELVAGMHVLKIDNGQWELINEPDEKGFFLRSITISDIDQHVKEVKSEVVWPQGNGINASVFFVTRFTDWQTASSGGDLCF